MRQPSCVGETIILYITKGKNPLLIKQWHAMDCEMPSNLSNVEIWTYFPFFLLPHIFFKMFFICFPPLKTITKRGTIQKRTRFKRFLFTLLLQLYSDITMALFKQIKQIIFNCSAWFWKKLPQRKNTELPQTVVREMIHYNYYLLNT